MGNESPISTFFAMMGGNVETTTLNFVFPSTNISTKVIEIIFYNELQIINIIMNYYLIEELLEVVSTVTLIDAAAFILSDAGDLISSGKGSTI